MWTGAIAALGAIALWWWQPRPIAVETALVRLAPVSATLVEQGEARAHDRYVVAAPVAGRLVRVELHEGDAVAPGAPLAWIAPLPLSPAEAEQARARLIAAEASQRASTADLARARAARAQARRETLRAEQLLAQRFVSGQALEQARLAEEAAQATELAARERVAAADAEVRNARSALYATRDSANPVALVAPAAGTVLRLVEQSERVLAQGSPVVVVGDPSRIEIVAELLSNDAVQVRPGMKASVSAWGGAALPARVRRVEPAAFTKVSALGVEEQRVKVVLDLDAPAPGLGDAYRVETRIELAHRPQALVVPKAALFRSGSEWRVFLIDRDRLLVRSLGVGLQGAEVVEVLEGLNPGDRVVIYPAASLAAGAKVRSIDKEAP